MTTASGFASVKSLGYYSIIHISNVISSLELLRSCSLKITPVNTSFQANSPIVEIQGRTNDEYFANNKPETSFVINLISK